MYRLCRRTIIITDLASLWITRNVSTRCWRPIMWTLDGGEVAHVFTRCALPWQNNRSDLCSEIARFDPASSVLCRGVKCFSWVVDAGAGGAYVWETDGVDSDPLPSMISCGGWQTCSQMEE
ncbi:Hypothetical predicted protein [Scomber scombrus]|uniref:Uncharacterized protein n=1 Tax=Scomber scombrus TaxID=13677 RepID=A0AAV1NN86_SCOSC